MDDRVYEDNLIDPTPVPNVDVDSERAVLCLCMSHDKALEKSAKNLTKDDFSDSRNQVIFEHIMSMYMESRKIDRYTIADYLEDNGRINAAGTREYLYGIADMVAVQLNIDDYIGSVVEKSRLRKINMAFTRFAQLSASGRQRADSIIDESVTELSSMRREDDTVGFEKLDKIVKDTLNYIKDVASGKVKKSVNTGFLKLDKKMGGMAPGSLNIIAARPGMGKTAFAINIATNVATMYGYPVNIFSLEMSKAEIGNRVLAARTKATARDLQSANVSQEVQDQILSAIKDLQDLKIYVDDTSNVTPVPMLSKLKELKASGKIGLVIVDYIQLMGAGTNRAGANRQSEIADISRSLKLMAKEMEVPVIALSQLSRGAEQRTDHTPMLSDLRDSGAIEQDADTVIFIDRPDYYNKDKSEEKQEINDANIILAKNRKGETGVVKLKWWGRRTMFFEPDENGNQEEPNARQSAYTRTTDGDSASASYTFDQDDYAEGTYEPPEEPEYNGENPDNDDFFNDSNDGFPEGMMD